MRMFQVDAFTDMVFRGNPAAIVVRDSWLPDPVMQAIAAENNLAETAFACPNGSGWALRWFTPTMEAGFCGHATLATAHILRTVHGATGTLGFETLAGTLSFEPVDAGYRMSLPVLWGEDLAALPAAIDGIFADPPRRIFRNAENIFAELADEHAVRAFTPDLLRVAGLGEVGLGIIAKGAETDFVSRYFFPGGGIPEDPVTGSTHSTLVPHWAAQLGRTRLTAFQASPRGGYLDCELAGDRVLLTGQAVTFMEAELFLD